jgi:hypothetical protein
MPQALRHLRANLVAYLALFVALGGTSYAAARLPRDSVGSTQLKRNAVTSSKVKNGTLTAGDLSAKTVSALRGKAGAAGTTGATGAPGATGTPGATGPQGPAGPQGAAGPTGPAGSTGPKGDKGDPGVTVAGWSGGVSAGALPADGIVTDLAGTHGSSSSGALTLAVQSRVYVDGAVNVGNTTGAPSRAQCAVRRADAGASDLVFDVTPQVAVNLPAVGSATSGDAAVLGSIALTGSVLLPAGTYDIGIVCQNTGSGAGIVLLNTAAMHAIAVPAAH